MVNSPWTNRRPPVADGVTPCLASRVANEALFSQWNDCLFRDHLIDWEVWEGLGASWLDRELRSKIAVSPGFKEVHRGSRRQSELGANLDSESVQLSALPKLALPHRRRRGESFSNFGCLLVSDGSARWLGNMDGNLIHFYGPITLNFKDQMVGLLGECAAVKRKLLPLLIGRG